MARKKKVINEQMYLAEERTFLAYVRTVLAFVGVVFVIVKIYIENIDLSNPIFILVIAISGVILLEEYTRINRLRRLRKSTSGKKRKVRS